MRLVIVQHELAKYPRFQRQRDEGHGTNIFPYEEFAVRGQTFVSQNVWHDQRLGVASSQGPRRVSCYSLPVFRGKSTPGLEPDHAVIIKRKDGRAIGHGCSQQTRDGGLVNVIESLGAA